MTVRDARSKKIALPVLLVLAANAANAAQNVVAYGGLDFSPCTLSAKDFSLNVEARCGALTVPEDWSAPNGKQIKLAIAWVPAKSEGDAAPDPVVMLAGGPGQAALEAYPGIAPAFKDILQKRHVLLIDQRGTGGSNPLSCEKIKADALADDTSPERVKRLTAICLASVERKANPRFYTTTEAVEDIEAVRKALNVARLNLIGISYGTRVAQHYLKRHPQQVRSMVLDGIVPSELILGSEHAENLEYALDLHFARCAKDPVCRKRFASPRLALRQLMAQAKSAPQTVVYRDAVSGERRTAVFSMDRLALLVRLYAYSPITAALLPQLLAQASREQGETLIALADLIEKLTNDQFSQALQLSVMCAEDEPFLKEKPEDADTVLGNKMIEYVKAQCTIWPKGASGSDFHQPLKSDKPVLIISGELDPVTPPRYGAQVLKQLTDGRHLIARGQGHNVLPVGCMPKVVGRFLRDLDPKKLDASCLDALAYVPFFTGLYGWEP